MLDFIYRFNPEGGSEYTTPETPAEANGRLILGNHEFAHVLDPRKVDSGPLIIPFDLQDLGIQAEGEAPKQHPFAAILACSDARVPCELIFNQACNAVFVVRVAGNVLGAECLGSLDYAVQNLRKSLRLLVVLGHSNCGAVTAAVDAFLEPNRYISMTSGLPIRAIVDRLFVSVHAAARALIQTHGADVIKAPGYRNCLIETSVAMNAGFTAAALHQEFSHAIGNTLQVVYGVYDLVSREVGVMDFQGEGRHIGLVRAPANQDDLEKLGKRLAACERVTGLLGGVMV